MPLACISCDHYQHKGMKQDSECPFVHYLSNKKKDKTHFGQCLKHNCNVYGTQLCNSHKYPAELMAVHPVQNRVNPLEPFQQALI